MKYLSGESINWQVPVKDSYTIITAAISKYYIQNLIIFGNEKLIKKHLKNQCFIDFSFFHCGEPLYT